MGKSLLMGGLFGAADMTAGPGTATGAEEPTVHMKLMHALLLGVLLSATSLSARSEKPAQPKPLVFTHVNVIDTARGRTIADMTAVVVGARIAALGASGEVQIEPGATVVDGTGKYLIPGLWDMHVHTGRKEIFFPLYIAHGVTGVRDMGGNLDRATGNLSIRLDLLLQWRDEIKEGKTLGPRMVLGGVMVDGPKPFWPGAMPVSNASEARKAVAELQQRGVDFIKVYSLVPRDAYFAIADESKKRDIPFAGHLPEAVYALEASEAGQSTIEHFATDAYLVACSTKEVELQVRRARMFSQMAESEPFVGEFARIGKDALDSYSEQKAAELFARFARNSTWQVPTLTVVRWDQGAEKNDPRNRYMPPYIRSKWASNRYMNIVLTPEQEALAAKVFEKQLEMLGAMHRAGVPILAGSDSANPYTYPGSSLHEELALLTRAGLTPADALRTATLNPAKFLGLQDELGTVEQGRLADLVLLEANPLEDIGNTRKIAAVVVNGRYLPKAELKKMLEDVEAAAKVDER